MSLQAAHDARIVGIAGGATRVDDDVHGRQFMLMVSKRFSDQPFEPVAPNRVADDARGNRQTQTCNRPVVGANENGEEGIGEAPRILIDAIEIRFVMKTLRRGERPGDCLQAGVLTVAVASVKTSDGEPFTALGTTASQHPTSGSGGHARTETVGTGTMDIARVVSALHAAISCWISGRENCAKTSTWWVQKKGGKGTQRAPECQARYCLNMPLRIASTLWITRRASV